MSAFFSFVSRLAKIFGKKNIRPRRERVASFNPFKAGGVVLKKGKEKKKERDRKYIGQEIFHLGKCLFSLKPKQKYS